MDEYLLEQEKQVHCMIFRVFSLWKKNIEGKKKKKKKKEFY